MHDEAGTLPTATLGALAHEIAACRACPRLVAWREAAAATPPARFQGEQYWARPVPGFGDPAARILVLGLAPAKDGGNRTGRVFTGDRSGDFLFAALHRAGLANQPTSVRPDDGLALRGIWVTAAVRCAPPGNAPLPDERDRCAPFLRRELAALPRLRVIVALGSYAWDAALRAIAVVDPSPGVLPRPLPRFSHGAEVRVGPYTLVGAYHPSQQNTFTGRLTPAMLDAVLHRAREVAGIGRVGRVHQVNVSAGGVPKLPVGGARVHRLGLEGDAHAEPEPIHGGLDQAVSLYAVEAIARVAADGHTAFPGAYGENLTLEGLDWAALRAGDRLAIGEGGLQIELTKYAAPCQALAHWFVGRQIARISAKTHPEDARWYARVLVEGPVAAGDTVELLPASG